MSLKFNTLMEDVNATVAKKCFYIDEIKRTGLVIEELREKLGKSTVELEELLLKIENTREI